MSFNDGWKTLLLQPCQVEQVPSSLSAVKKKQSREQEEGSIFGNVRYSRMCWDKRTALCRLVVELTGSMRYP